ncbi:MAG: DUF1905 domain-containing protein [Micropruina sp.]|nr:DUF1905 domain-containing protein [Micropruina sp.]
MDEITFTAPLWRAEAADAWRFVSLPVELADLVRLRAGPPRGFGSLRVEVTVGATTWRTSVFPDSRRGTYMLPMKKSVRQAELLEDDDDVTVVLRLIDA